MKRMARAAGVVVTPVVAILFLAACGSGSTTTTSQPAGPGAVTSSSTSPSGSSSSSTDTASTSQSSSNESESGSAAANAVLIKDFSFRPPTVTIKAGSTVTWTQGDDEAMHTVTADDNSFTSQSLARGATFTHTFAAPGTYAYHCSIHPNMKGVITVTA